MWNQEDSQYVRNKLVEYNSRHISDGLKSVHENVSLFLKDEEGKIFGGITGVLKWNYLKVDIFWIDDRLRGQGYGSRLLHEMEIVAQNHQCDFIELDTFSFQAPEFYLKNGFEIVGVVENAPKGHSHYYMIKRLTRP
nr:GNAT family N-acetyltransferase [Paenibacillus hamazuiensis]